MVLPRRTRRALNTAATTTAAAAAPWAALALAATVAAPAPAQAAPPTLPGLPGGSRSGPELRILSPRKNSDQSGGAAAATTLTLDVSFRGRSAAQGAVAAEVWVDGARWTRRELSGQLRGVLTLDLDVSTLPAGRHQVIVKLFAADGSEANRATTITVNGSSDAAAGTPASTPAGAPDIAFQSPGNGARVSGTVEIALDVKGATAAGRGNPFVSFYVDKEFKTLKNFPPYTFVWDTTNLPNGPHTIEASALADGTNAAPATRRMQVFVDNPGGNTVRMNTIPDLRAPRSAPAPAPVTPAATAAPLVIPAPSGRRSAPPRSAGASASALAAPAGASLIAPRPAARLSAGPGLRANVVSRGARFGAAAGSVLIAAPAARLVVPATAAPAAPALSLPTALVPVTPGLRTAGLDWTAAATALRPLLPTSLARPQKAPVLSRRFVRASAPLTARGLASGRRGVVVPPLVLPATIAMPAAASAAPRRAATIARSNTNHSPIQVAFDGQKIAFDVAPHVEAGLPVAPFRQIFEHTGGRVTWVAETRVVRAVNAEREIVISVGKNTARVNNQSVSLDRPAALEGGRTIVPLSFVRKALDVNVQYDPATGHLLITSRK